MRGDLLARQWHIIREFEVNPLPEDYRRMISFSRVHSKNWEDLERDKAFVAAQKLTEGAEEVFVNGDSLIPKAKALEPLFKARMFAPVEA